MKQIKNLTLNEFSAFINIYSKEYTLQIDQEIELIKFFFGLTEEEVDELPISEYNKLVEKVLSVEQHPEEEAYYVFTHDNKEYKVRTNADGTFTFKVKDKRLIEIYIKQYPEKLFSIVASIVFSNEDYSEEGILERAELFGNNMPMKYLSAHFNTLKTNL